MEQLATAKATEKRLSYRRDCFHIAVLLISRFFSLLWLEGWTDIFCVKIHKRVIIVIKLHVFR